MNYFKKPWLIPTLLTIVILTVGGLYITSLIKKEEPITAGEIQAQVESMYGGTVDQMSRKGDIYNVEMTRNGATYSAEINAVTGSVISLSQLTGAIGETPQHHVLSEAEVKEVLAGKYSGEIERVSLNTTGKSPVYEVKLAKDPKFTKVTVDAITGNTISETVKEMTGKNALITQEQATKIALKQLKPEIVDEVDDVSYEKTDDGGFYLIEIDTKDNREVDFRIHAISGKIMSVTWEED